MPGERRTPRSVTSAVTSAAGVTSKAGLRVRVPGIVRSCPAAARTSSGSRSSIAMSRPVGVLGSIVEVGPATTNGMPAARAASARPYVPTLLATSPLAATRSQPTITASTAPAAIRPAAAESTTSSCGISSLASSYTVSRAPCRSGRDSVAMTISSRPRAASSAITASAVPRPGAASAPVLQWVRIRRASASRSAPWAAIASLAASSSASIARASSSAIARVGGVGAARTARRWTRSTAVARLTAVGRAARRVSQARSRASRPGSRASSSATP